MIMPTIRGFIIAKIVNRNPAILFVVVVRVGAQLRRTVRRFVDRPGRNRNPHAKRQPDKGEQSQKMADGMVHNCPSRRWSENLQSRIARSAAIHFH